MINLRAKGFTCPYRRVSSARIFLAQWERNDMKEDPSTRNKPYKNGGGDYGL